MSLLFRLLSKNTNWWLMACYTVAGVLGAMIVIAGLQAWRDIRTLYGMKDSFIGTNYVVITKSVSSLTTVITAAGGQAGFTENEKRDLEQIPGVTGVGGFTSAQFSVYGMLQIGSRAMQTQMFLESVPDRFVDLPDGRQIPMSELATISYQPGPMQISRDGASRRVYVGLNARGRDVASIVADIDKAIKQKLHLPYGYRITYDGSFKNLQEATSRMAIVVPIALLIIFLLLYFALKSVVEALMIYIAVPLATLGGVIALAVRGMPFSISAGVGFIVLSGVAVLNGLVLINRFNTLKAAGVKSVALRIHRGTRERLRPILLTAAAAMLGFLPMAVSGSAGAEVQRPLATVVIGGLFTSTMLTLVLLPVLYAIVAGLGKRKTTK